MSGDPHAYGSMPGTLTTKVKILPSNNNLILSLDRLCIFVLLKRIAIYEFPFEIMDNILFSASIIIFLIFFFFNHHHNQRDECPQKNY